MCLTSELALSAGKEDCFVRILMLGDIVGRPGRECVKALLPALKKQYKVDVTVANGENLASGAGFTEKTALEVFNCGVDLLTMGNHVWDRRESIEYLEREKRIVRPLNYPPGAPGHGFVVYNVGDKKMAVINISGRVYMPALDCPFRAAEQAVAQLREITPVILVDFHAEATSEKIAMGHFLDGRVSMVLGTHTHVQTADEKILPGGTAYITDVGMTGPYESILGVEPGLIIRKFLTQMPVRFEVAKDPVCQLNGVVVEVDAGTGKAQNIERVNLIHSL